MKLEDLHEKGAKCPACGQHMLVAEGCTYPAFQFGDDDTPKKEVHARLPYEGGWSPESDPKKDRCGDCGAKVGGLHHDGCDVERCPRCGMQAIGCDCYEEPQFGGKTYVVKAPVAR